MADYSRQGLKKNELEGLLVWAADWIKQNRQLFSTIAGTAAVVVALTIFFFARYHIVRARADDKLAYAQGYFNQGKSQEALGIFDEIINSIPGTSADYKARFNKAMYLSEVRKFDEAEKPFCRPLKKAKPKTIIPLAMSVLGAIRENAGKYQQAITVYNNFLDTYPSTIYRPRYTNLSRGCTR